MFNFDEAKIRQEHQNGVDIIHQVEKHVDQAIPVFFTLESAEPCCMPIR